jgi:hypothetical protein
MELFQEILCLSVQVGVAQRGEHNSLIECRIWSDWANKRGCRGNRLHPFASEVFLLFKARRKIAENTFQPV